MGGLSGAAARAAQLLDLGLSQQQLDAEWQGGRRLLLAQRHLHSTVTDSWTFKYIIIAFAATAGALLIGLIALLLYCCWGRGQRKVHPANKIEYTGMAPGQGYTGPSAAGGAGATKAPEEPGNKGTANDRQQQQQPLVSEDHQSSAHSPQQQQQQQQQQHGAQDLPPPPQWQPPLPVAPPQQQQQQQQQHFVPEDPQSSAYQQQQQQQQQQQGLQSRAVPAAILLAPEAPLQFRPYISNARPIGAPPYERLVLVSSRVAQPMKVVEALQPNVAVVVYDWRNSTVQDIVRLIKRTVGLNKVYSLAIIAPGDNPGCVGLLERAETTPAVLQQRGELLQFWRVLASCVRPSGINDGRRVDLLGCRVVEAPREGAALLKALWMKTAVPFAAADDAAGGYQLATFMEEPNSGSLSLIASPIKGLDLYFKRDKLLDNMAAPAPGPPGPGPQYPVPAATDTRPTQQSAPSQPAAPLPPAPPPVTPPPVAQTRPDAAVAAAAAAPASDIFERFVAAVAAQGKDLRAVFRQYDTQNAGQLSYEQVAKMVADFVPDARKKDLQHFVSMMDIDGNSLISTEEFVATLEQNRGIHSKLRSGNEDSELLELLHNYLTDNVELLSEYFRMTDKDGNGILDHAEVARFVQEIPGEMTPEDRKYLIGYLYQSDQNHDGVLTLQEMQDVLTSFQGPARVTVATHQGGYDSSAAPAAAYGNAR